VTPNVVNTKPDRTVEWTCSDGDFRVVFDGNESPFDSGHREVRGSASSGNHRTKTLGARRTRKFKYTVFVGQFFVDPEIIITDEGGSGGTATKKRPASKAAKKAPVKKAAKKAPAKKAAKKAPAKKAAKKKK
jgi:hypothetical protein